MKISSRVVLWLVVVIMAIMTLVSVTKTRNINVKPELKTEVAEEVTSKVKKPIVNYKGKE
jgi:F0F1-type ATP synthase membrane subunit a